MRKHLIELRNSLKDYEIFGKDDVLISKIIDDSRKAEKGSLFVAIKGLTVDAHKFIPSVISSGAAVVVGEKEPKKSWLNKISYIKVPNSRRALAFLASCWYDEPSKKLKIIGVTGTDGKTTTSNILHWILNKSGKEAGLVSTVSAKIGGKEYSTGLHGTNPEPLQLQKFLAKMVQKKCEYAVLEVTSHGLDQERVAGINFNMGILTNVTHEHIDYHKTYKNYVKAKAKLFESVKVAILNKDDKSYDLIRKSVKTKTKIIPYNQKTLSDKIKRIVVERFPEEYNQLNATAAILAAKEFGVSEKCIVQSIKSFPGVSGRMEEIKNNRGIKIFVDFAHTPNALKSVLKTFKNTKGKNEKLIAVFGCAGERDVEKRPTMGKVSAEFADISVFTAEDPRSEDANKIIDEMMEGVRKIEKSKRGKVYRKVERGEAIAFAVQKLAKKGDVVVICGKGHEKSLAYNGTEHPWSDQKVARIALKHVHFMGIGGSGISAAALIARSQGYGVSGCDLAESTPYLDKVKKLKIPVFAKHDSKHLKGIDILAASPAAYFQNSKHPEFVAGKKAKKLITWQKFLGKYLQKEKQVICIAGTHGKSTTTAMAGLLFEKAGLDPNVMIGATIKEWGANFRYGKSVIFITEADEFFDNFLNYRPNYIILNNIEFDHPDFFKSEEQVFQSFDKFVRRLVAPKTLIVNYDSPGVKKLLGMLDKKFLKSINLIGYNLKDWDNTFKLQVPGDYNKANALGVIALAKLFDIKMPVIKKSLFTYTGIGRRTELIGEKRGIKVYDDYAHHPTAVSVTLEALRQQFPNQRLWVVIELHSYSRTKVLLEKYKKAFKHADIVIIGPIFKARDTETFGITEQSVVDVAGHTNIKHIDQLDGIAKSIKKSAKPGDVIVVMGAGMSYKWAREILNNL